MSRKKFSPRPDAEKIFVSRSSPLPVSVPLDSLERFLCGLFAYPRLSSSRGSIKKEVKEKDFPSTGRRKDFCLEIQPTACECAPRFAREVPLWLVCISVAFIFQG